MGKVKNKPRVKEATAHSIRNRNLGVRRVRACDLVPHPLNWRQHPKAQQDALRAVLEEVGFVGTLLASELPDGRLGLIDGHLRTETLPNEEVDVMVVDLSPEEAAKVLATHDPLAAMAEANAEALDKLLREVQTGDEALAAMLEGLAQDAGVLDGLGGEVVKDEVPEPPKEAVSRTGDLWILGEHRLLCGDSTKAEDVARVMGGERPYLMATDPPYGVNFSGAKYNPRAKEWDGIVNDELAGADLEAFVKSMLDAWLPLIHEQAGFYFWTAAMQEGAAAAAVRAAGLHIQSQIIWNKNALVLGQADYHWKHENCWYAFRKGAKHRWFGDLDKTTVWEVKKLANSAYEHPMQKPIELYAIPMRHHTREGEAVAEPFSGSGSQIIAAEQLSRRCFAIEIAPIYVDVAVQRWERLTSREAILDSTGRTFAEAGRERCVS